MTNDTRVASLVSELGSGHDLNLVFVRTKRGADRLVKRLAGENVQAAAMHGNKSQRQRERALADFEKGKVTTLVATDVAARGIHVDGISKVINFDPPGQTEDYVHRTGRTGRAGERGVAVTFVSQDQLGDMKKMTRQLKLSDELQSAVGDSPHQSHRSGKPSGGGQNGGGKPNGGGNPNRGRPSNKKRSSNGGSGGGDGRSSGPRNVASAGSR